MSTAYQIASRFELVQRRKPIKSTAYLKFIRSLTYCACGGNRRIEAAHIGPRGLGQKRDDQDALPLCQWCHRELHQVGPLAFEAKYKLDFPELIEKFRGFYDSNLRGTW